MPVIENPDYPRLTDDDEKPFNSVTEANFYAEWWYPDTIIVETKDGDKICKASRSNAWQPDGAFIYYFQEVKE